MAKFQNIDGSRVAAAMRRHTQLVAGDERWSELQRRLETDVTSLREPGRGERSPDVDDQEGKRRLMGLSPAFQVSATHPQVFEFESRAPEHPRVFATLQGFGGWSKGATFSLPAQVANDELLLGYSPASLTDEADFTDVADAIWRRSAVMLWVRLARDVGANHQLLIIFGLRGVHIPADTTMQFFVGTDWVRSESIHDGVETVALLIDAPPISETENESDAFYPAYYDYIVYARMASEAADSAVALTGIHGYIL